jgi:hypothetical protein
MGNPLFLLLKNHKVSQVESAASSLNDTQVDTTRLNGGLWWIYGFVACHNFRSEMWSISYFRQVHYKYILGFMCILYI